MGVPVTFEPGWDTRGNGQSSAYQGGIIHHTGGSYAATCPGILIYGRSDLSGPLCNFAGLTGGGIHVVAAHPANHAGASGGPSVGPFPITNLFNKLVMGLEICYPGAQPMTNEQYRTAKVFAKVMAIMFGSIERARAHRETSVEGKWDPGWAPGQTIDMAELRAAAANVEGDDVSAEEVWEKKIFPQIDPEAGDTGAPWTDAAEHLKRARQYAEKSVWQNERIEAALGSVGTLLKDIAARVERLELSGVPVKVDFDVAGVAKAVNDEDDRRDRDDDPNTGART
jgi:hypothetical protein